MKNQIRGDRMINKKISMKVKNQIRGERMINKKISMDMESSMKYSVKSNTSSIEDGTSTFTFFQNNR